MTTIFSLLEKFRKAKTSNRDLGDKFERLFANYLVTDLQCIDQFDAMWLWWNAMRKNYVGKIDFEETKINNYHWHNYDLAVE